MWVIGTEVFRGRGGIFTPCNPGRLVWFILGNTSALSSHQRVRRQWAFFFFSSFFIQEQHSWVPNRAQSRESFIFPHVLFKEKCKDERENYEHQWSKINLDPVIHFCIKHPQQMGWNITKIAPVHFHTSSVCTCHIAADGSSKHTEVSFVFYHLTGRHYN